MLKFALQYESIGSFVREFTGKISTKGLSLKTAKPIEIGDKVGLLFKLKTGEETFTALGEVTWVEDPDAATGKKGLIIRNIALDAESKRIVSEYLATETVETHEPVPAGAPAPAPAPPRPAAVRTPTPVYQAPEPKRRWPLYLLLTILLLGGAGGGFGYWYVELGGDKVIAALGVDEREGRVTSIESSHKTFLMGLTTQRSSDWRVATSSDTEWVGLRGLSELQEDDRILLRYRADGDVYNAQRVVLQERSLTGRVVDILDAGAGILEVADDEGPLELTAESNAMARATVQEMEEGDTVSVRYALDDPSKRHIREISVIERTTTGEIAAVDASERTLRLALEAGDVDLSSNEETVLEDELAWSELGEKDRIRVTFAPERGRIRSLAMVEKYVKPEPEPEPAPRRPPPKPPKAVLQDVIHSADDKVARFALDFNRSISFEGPFRLDEPARYVVRVANARSELARSEVFLRDAPLRTLRIETDGDDVVLTFLITRGFIPTHDVRTEGDRLVALFFAR